MELPGDGVDAKVSCRDAVGHSPSDDIDRPGPVLKAMADVLAAVACAEHIEHLAQGANALSIIVTILRGHDPGGLNDRRASGRGRRLGGKREESCEYEASGPHAPIYKGQALNAP